MIKPTEIFKGKLLVWRPTDESHFRKLTSKYVTSFVIAHPEGNQAAPVTANETDSLSNEYQGPLLRQNL
jgi:hypothetical protein